MVMRAAKGQVLALPPGLTIQQGTTRARVPRRPSHPFHLSAQYPYEITPFFIAPVLAGETMENLLLQCRTVSTAVENPLIGHHLEHYFFYVKLRDLADASDITAMLMETGAHSVTTSAGDVDHYVVSGAIAWSEMCLNSIVAAWFRDEGETVARLGTGGLPLAQWSIKNSIFNSLIDDADLETDAVTAAEPFPDHEQAYNNWLFMRQTQLTELTFEDYLATFGVVSSNEAESKPELIRFVKNWTYPTNTVDAAGAINTQLSWSVQERADKDRFFKEPGFLFGVSIARPKVYLGSQIQSAVSVMNNALAWLPATMKENVHSSLKKVAAGDDATSPLLLGTLPASTAVIWDDTDPYWLDVRDLLVHGDQFVRASTATGVPASVNGVMPIDLMDFHGKKYPLPAGLQALGVGDALTYNSDGIVSLNVLGTQVDMT